MARAAKVFIALILGANLFTAVCLAQERSEGISIHMLPKRVADLGGQPWGFTVDSSPRVKVQSRGQVIQSVADLLAFVRTQDAGVQENGVWIVITNPDAYSGGEKALLENVKSMCSREKIPLFICRASKLPDGWVRFDQ